MFYCWYVMCNVFSPSSALRLLVLHCTHDFWVLASERELAGFICDLWTTRGAGLNADRPFCWTVFWKGLLLPVALSGNNEHLGSGQWKKVRLHRYLTTDINVNTGSWRSWSDIQVQNSTWLSGSSDSFWYSWILKGCHLLIGMENPYKGWLADATLCCETSRAALWTFRKGCQNHCWGFVICSGLWTTTTWLVIHSPGFSEFGYEGGHSAVWNWWSFRMSVVEVCSYDTAAAFPWYLNHLKPLFFRQFHFQIPVTNNKCFELSVLITLQLQEFLLLWLK